MRDYAKPMASKKKAGIRFPFIDSKRPRGNRRKRATPEDGAREKMTLGMKSPFLSKWRQMGRLKKSGVILASVAAPFVINNAVHKWVMQPRFIPQSKRPAIALKYRKYRMMPKAEIARKTITPKTIEAWKRMVAGEVATSLIGKGDSLDTVSKKKWEIAERIAETVMHRQMKPGWNHMSYSEIIRQPWAYQTYNSLTYHKEIAFQPEAYQLASKVVDGLIARGKPIHEPATHYFMRRKYALDRNGKIIYGKGKTNGKPRLSTKPDPPWARGLKPVRVFSYTDSKSKKKGPMMVYFYNIER